MKLLLALTLLLAGCPRFDTPRSLVACHDACAPRLVASYVDETGTCTCAALTP